MIEEIKTYSYHEISELLQKYIPEIGYYNHSFLERRFNSVCTKLHIPNIEAFQEKINNDLTFIDEFMHHVTVPVTEMFRDASVWKTINEQILPTLIVQEHCNIWFPVCSTGEELFSLCILLKQLNVTDNVTIYASHRSIHSIEIIKKGIYPIRNENLHNLNYSKIMLPNSLDSFYSKSFNTIYMNASLLSNVKFLYSTSILQQIPSNLDLVMFRNSLLYYDNQMHHIIISKICEQMKPNGFLILGLQDNNSILNMNALFKTENKEDRIYRKK